MQIGSADTRSRDPDDGVLRMQDLRHGFMVDADPMRPPVIHGKHRSGSFLFGFYVLLRRTPRSPSAVPAVAPRLATGCIPNQLKRLRENARKLSLAVSCPGIGAYRLSGSSSDLVHLQDRFR